MSFEQYVNSARDQTTLTRVIGLLGVASAFTALGAFVGPALGQLGFWVALIGGFITLLVLRGVREVAPINLVLLGVFAILECVVLGQVLELYVSSGLGFIVFQAAASTAVATLVAGAAGYTTRRDLSGFGGYLLAALLIVIVASVIGLLVQVPRLETAN